MVDTKRLEELREICHRCKPPKRYPACECYCKTGRERTELNEQRRAEEHKRKTAEYERRSYIHDSLEKKEKEEESEMKLYEISDHLMKVLESGFSVDEETGEILFDDTDLEQLDMALNEKLENVMLVIKNLSSDEEALKNEKANIAARQKSKARRREWLEGYMCSVMKRTGKTTFETEKGVAKLSNRKSTIIDDEALIPMEYMKEKVDYSPDKTAIKKAIEAGEIVPGARYDVPEGKINIK